MSDDTDQCPATLSTLYATWERVEHCDLEEGHRGPHESADHRWDD